MTGDAPGELAPVLVGVDFSPGSRAALAWAVDAAIAFGSPLLAVHVAHDPAESPGTYVRGEHGDPEDRERVARDMMDEFIVEARKDTPRFDEVRRFDHEVVMGLPVNRILEVAKRENARLIVMGAQGRTALADVLLGSKVGRIVRLAPIPVTVVRMPPRPDEPDRLDPPS